MHSYPDEDYLSRPVEDLFCSIWDLFSFASVRDSNNYTKVKVFNAGHQTKEGVSNYTTVYMAQKLLG